ncbi:MAG: sugar phosphate isomerase/epimerase family protein [Planctomycetota bacterium]|jgi:sugar phosphate isomerase/epimerase
MKPEKISRREMMVKSALTIGGVAFAGSCQPSACEKSATKSCGKGFKIGICDWTLGKRTNPESFALARSIGLDGVQVDMGSAKDNLPLRNRELQYKFIETARQNNVEIGSVAMGVLNRVPYKSEPEAEQWVLDSIEACRALGCEVLLLAFFGKGDLRNDHRGVAVVVERLKRAADKAGEAGVILAVESQLSAEQHMDILERVGSPAVQVYYDVANSHKNGYDIYKEIRYLGKHICEFHAKDNDDLYGKGSINFPEVRKAMDDAGYRGWMHMEGTKMPLGLLESCRYDCEYLRRIFPPKV